MAGQSFEVRAAGAINGYGPSGSGMPASGNFCAPNLSEYSLIGRIDGGQPFLIGSYYQGMAATPGLLELGQNDDGLPHGDNGAFYVLVSTDLPSASATVYAHAGCQGAIDVMYVEAGDPLVIAANGIVNNGNGDFGPDGNVVIAAPGEGFCLSNIPEFALIGRIDSGSFPRFYIGSLFAGIAPETGMLSLGMNDNFYSDNSGAFEARVVTTTPQSRPPWIQQSYTIEGTSSGGNWSMDLVRYGFTPGSTNLTNVPGLPAGSGPSSFVQSFVCVINGWGLDWVRAFPDSYNSGTFSVYLSPAFASNGGDLWLSAPGGFGPPACLVGPGGLMAGSGNGISCSFNPTIYHGGGRPRARVR